MLRFRDGKRPTGRRLATADVWRRGQLRPGFVQPAHEVRPLKGLDLALLATGIVLAIASVALLASR